MKLVALIGDPAGWEEASVAFLVIPPGRNVRIDLASYPGFVESGKVSQDQWLVDNCGYFYPTEEDLVIYGEEYDE